MKIYSDKKDMKWNLLEWILTLVVYALVLLMATKIFKGFYVTSFWYAILAALVISILNSLVKPFLQILTLPITVVTLGIFIPFIDVIILKLTGLIMGNNFVVEGWLVPFFIAIFISLMTVILDSLITKRIVGGK
jgi:putative membrane protein